MQAKNLKKNFGHNCKLQSENFLAALIPGRNCCIFVRRLYHYFFMISENNHRSKIFCRSQLKLGMEIINHVDHYAFTIHPTSRFRIFWELFMILVDILSLTYIPLTNGFSLRADQIYSDTDKSIRAFVTFFSVTDIVLNFITGYYDVTNEINNDYGKIALNYITGRFFFDLVSSVCAIEYDREAKSNDIIVFNCFLFLIFRIFRMVNFVTYVENSCEVYRVSAVKYRLICLFFIMVILIHWSACFLIMLGIYDSGINANSDPNKKSWYTHHGLWNSTKLQIYTTALYRSTCFLSGSEHNNLIVAKTGYRKNYRWIKIFYWIMARVLFAIFVSMVLQIVLIGYSGKLKYRKKMHKILQFFDQKQISEKLKSRVRAYYKFKYRNSITKEEDILRDVSQAMKQDIVISNRMELIEKIAFFKGLPENILLKLCSKFIEQIFLPGDIIMKTGNKVDHLQIILYGTVAVYTKSGIEIKHISDGSYFGEVELFSQEKLAVSTMVALEPCVIFYLHRKEFLKTIAFINQYPEHMQRIQAHIDDNIRKNKMTQMQFQQWLLELKEVAQNNEDYFY